MSLISLTKPANPTAVLSTLIKKLNIRVSPFTLKQDLEMHPDFPSLLALSDCLNSWKVAHEAYRINKKDYKAEDLSFPFIAHLTENGGQFMLINSIKDGQVHYSDQEEANGTVSEEQFLKRWDGIILYAEKDENSGEANYTNNLIKGWLDAARLPFIVLVLLIGIFTAVNYNGGDWSYLALLGIKVAGVVVSGFLLMHSIDANNPFIQNLCSLGKKNNCNTILKSDAAKVTSWLSWSEVGMFYFAGSLICLLVNPASFGLLAWLNLACLPYTLYSIGYQIKIKNWCVLCCSVQILLWLEAGAFLVQSNYVADFQAPVIISALISFLFPIAIWSFIKPFMLKAGQTKPLNQQLKKFKYNSDLFQQLLTSTPRYSVPDELMPVVLGNPEAKTVITMVSNPFCGPCATAHKALDEWLVDRSDIQLKIVFTTANHEDDARTKVSRHVAALSLLEDKSIVGDALNDWYAQSNKKYESWAVKYPATFNGEMNAVTERQKEWCDLTEITFTPTILVNGYKLIEPYRLEDIKYLV